MNIYIDFTNITEEIEQKFELVKNKITEYDMDIDLLNDLEKPFLNTPQRELLLTIDTKGTEFKFGEISLNSNSILSFYGTEPHIFDFYKRTCSFYKKLKESKLKKQSPNI